MISKNWDYINDIEGIFDNCKNLEIVKINGFNLGSNITSLKKLFLNLPKLIKIDIDAFNINYVEDFSYMFANSNIKNIKLKINTNSANNMAHIFLFIFNFFKYNNFKTSNVQKMNYFQK